MDAWLRDRDGPASHEPAGGTQRAVAGTVAHGTAVTHAATNADADADADQATAVGIAVRISLTQPQRGAHANTVAHVFPLSISVADPCPFSLIHPQPVTEPERIAVTEPEWVTVTEPEPHPALRTLTAQGCQRLLDSAHRLMPLSVACLSISASSSSSKSSFCRASTLLSSWLTLLAPIRAEEMRGSRRVQASAS